MRCPHTRVTHILFGCEHRKKKVRETVGSAEKVILGFFSDQGGAEAPSVNNGYRVWGALW